MNCYNKECEYFDDKQTFRNCMHTMAYPGNCKDFIPAESDNSRLAERVVMCQYFGCDKPATLKIVRANTNVCDDHFYTNILKFGCIFETEPVNIKKEGT